MRVLSWNILQGGGTRVPRILEEVTAFDPDIIALTAFRSSRIEEFRPQLRAAGWPHWEIADPPHNENGIAVFSQLPILPRKPAPAPPDESGRWLDLELPGLGFTIGILHIQAAAYGPRHPSTAAKIRFWDAVIEAAAARLGQPFLLLGDWNTGAYFTDEPAKSFVCAAHFERLSAIGWTDVWRHCNPGETEFTWYSARRGGGKGKGFRVDHAFATPALLPRIKGCRYAHAPREARISDHSLLIVDVAA